MDMELFSGDVVVLGDKLANKLGVAKREMSLFEGVFDSRVTNVK